MNEFTIEADSFAFAAGETVEFLVTNSGVIEHELRLSNQARVDEHLEGGHDDHDDSMSEDEMPNMDDEAAHDDDEAAHDDDEAAHEEIEAVHEDDDDHAVADAVLVLGAGETGTLVFTFPDNDHDYTAAVCLLPGHYEAGMATDLTVDA